MAVSPPAVQGAPLLLEVGRRAARLAGQTEGRGKFVSALVSLWPVALFLACSLFLFRRSIFEGHVFFQNDTFLFYFPIERLIDSALAQGELPLWTPYIFGGHPLLADGEAGMFYPPNLIAYFLLPAPQAMIALRVLRFFLAALFAYWYGRALGQGRVAASVLGLAFAYGSFTVGQIHHTNVGTTALWLPLVLAAIERSFVASPRRRPVYLVGAAFALGMATLNVHINPLLMMLGLIAVYVPFRLFVCADVVLPGLVARLRRATFTLAVTVGLGMALGAIQLLPLWELGSFSRGRGVAFDFASGFALPPANLVTLIFPYFFRDAADGYWSPWFRWNTTVYVGVAPLLLAAFALVRVRRAFTFFFAGLVVVSLVLAFGDYPPLKPYSLLYQLPVFSMVRGPARFAYLATFALAVLAGIGTQALTRSLLSAGGSGWRNWPRVDPPVPSVRRFIIGAGLFGVLAVSALYGALSFTEQAPEMAKEMLKAGYMVLRGAGLERVLARDPFAALRYSLDPGSPWTQRGLLLIGLTVALVLLWYRLRRGRLLWQLALISLVAFDLVGFADRFHPRMTIDELVAPGAAARFLQENAAGHRVLTLWPAFATWPDRLLPLRVYEASGYSSLTPQRTERFLDKARQGAPSFLALMNVRYLVAAKDREPAWLKGKTPAFSADGVVVYDWPVTLPHAFVAATVRSGTSAEVLAGIGQEGFDPRQTVWLEADGPPDLRAARAAGASPATTEVRSSSDGSVTIQVSTAEPGMLVLTDSYYPGWTAYVDGNEQPVYRADYLFRGVALSPGQHTVRFVYEPLSIRLGAAITLGAVLAALAVLGTLVIGGIRRRTAAAG